MRDEKTPEEYIQEVEERTKFIYMSLTASMIFSDVSETTIISHEITARCPSSWSDGRFKDLSREQI